MKGIAQRFREFLRKKRFFEDDLKKLEEQTGIDRKKLAYTIRDFARRGEIERKDGKLIYKGLKSKFLIADRVWRAWRYMPTWTVSDVAAMCDCSRETVLSYVKLYRKAGYVENVGRKKINGVWVGVYRLKNRKIRQRPRIYGQRELKGVKPCN